MAQAEELRRHYDEWHEAALASAELPPASAREEERYLRWILGLLSAAPGASLLDVACGTGGFALRAAQQGLKVTGVDLSAVAVEAARRRVPDAEFVVADAEALPFEDASFHHVTCLGSLEHFPSPERGAAEMRRVLRPGGTAALFVPNLFFLGHVYFGLRHGVQPTEGGQSFSEVYRSSGGWRELIEGAGFEVVGVRAWNRIHASQRVSVPVQKVWLALSRFVPLNCSYAFAFVCTRR